MCPSDDVDLPAARRSDALDGELRGQDPTLQPASLEWGVHTTNAHALEFYRRLGAVAAEVRIMGVSGERLRALAAAAF